MKKFLSIILAILMIVTTVPMAFAADIKRTGTFGADGKNLTWTLYSDGLFTISGKGSMGSFDGPNDVPWYGCYYFSKRLVIEEGVTDIGDSTDASWKNITSAVIPDSVTTIGEDTFTICESLTDVVIGSGLKTVAYMSFYWVPENCTVHYNGTPEMLDAISGKENLPATIHYLSEVGSKEPTCTVNGYINAQSCSTCDFIFGGEIIPAEGHNYVNNVCTVCGDGCEHNWQDGVCTLCSFACKHSSYTDSKCDVCGKSCCEHSEWFEGVCTSCSYACEHSEYTNSICNVCGEACVHSWKDGVCENCKLTCEHTSWSNGKCSTCSYACAHPTYTDSVCNVCGETCAHSWKDSVCENCGLTCGHTSWYYGICSTCSYACAHPTYTDSVCDVCKKPCAHRWKDNVCELCGFVCGHTSWYDGKCSTCSYACAHPTYIDSVCTVCKKTCAHSWKDSVCEICGFACGHTSWYNGKCSTCRYACTHPEWKDQKCVVCSSACTHPEYIDSICTVCKSACTHNSWASGRCTSCSYKCDHSDWDYDRCRVCRMEGTRPGEQTNIKWYYDKSTNYLQITGVGDMPEYGDPSMLPWRNYYLYMKTVVIEEGITSVSVGAFGMCSSITSVTLPDTLTEIGRSAFYTCTNLKEVIVPSSVTTVHRYSFAPGTTVHYCGASDALNIVEGDPGNYHFCYTKTEGVKATCTETGIADEWYCASCNDKYIAGGEVTPVDPDAHDWSNKDGICANGCGAECAHEDAYNNLIRPEQNADGTWGKGKIVKICNTCGNSSIVQEVERDHEGYEALEEAAAELEALLNSDELISGAKTTYTNNLNYIKRAASSMVYTEIETGLSYMLADINSYIAAIEAGLADGTMRRADLSYMTSLFNEVNAIINGNASLIIPSEVGKYWGPYYYHQGQLNNSNLSQEDYNRNMAEYDFENQLIALIAGLKDGTMLKADYTAIDEAIAELDEKLADENLTDEAKAGLEEIKADLEEMKKNPITSKADLAELEKALEDYETELDAGIADGSALKVNGLEEIVNINDKLNNELAEKYGEEALAEIAEKLDEKFADKFDELYERAEALTGSVAENKDALAEIEAEMEAIFAEAENCLNGTHNGLKFEITEEAKCGKNAVESATCTLCGETVTREVENSALNHTFSNYIYNEDATCTADGTKTAACDNGCGVTDTVTAKGTKLNHADEDSNDICDDCGTEIVKTCPDCGRPVHEGQINQFICIVLTLIRLIVSFFRAVR